MAVPLSADEYQAAIDNLTEHLDRALARNDLIVLPRVVWKPFKQPTESMPGNALRHLSQQFTGRNASNLFKLSPQVFVHLVSILLCATNSAKQDRLLHALISALRTWTDHVAIWAAIRRKKINIDKDAVLHHSTILRRDLTKTALRALISFTIDLEARRCAAQMLAIAIKNHNETRQCMTAVDCAHLGQLVQVHDDYVLRFLAADVLRELLSNGTDSESCWPPNTSRAIIDPFPVANNTSTLWLLDAQDHLSDIDKHMGFHGSRMSVFRVKRCHHWKDAGSSQEDNMMENILVCLSSHVNCIIADESNGLYVASYPVLGQQSMSVVDEPSADKRSATLTVEFANDEGCRIMAGTKEAVRGLQLELESPGQAAEAAKILRELQQTAEQQHQADSADQNTEDVLAPNPRKRSIAIIDLSSSPRQEAMNTSRQAGYAADQSNTYPLSPLQQKTDQLATANALENMIDEMATPEDSAQVVNGPSKSFQEKMRAGDQVAGSNRAKQRKAPESRVLQGLQDVKSAPLPPSVSGTLKTGDKNPPQIAQKRTSSRGLEQRSNETRTHLRQTKSSVRPSRAASSSLEADGSHLKYIEKSDATEPQDTRATSRLSKKNVVKPLSKEKMATSGEGQLQALKRPKPGTRGSRNEVDWDEDTRDLRDFDIPEDEDPQPKKARLGGKESAGKTTAGKSSQVIWSSRFKKPSLPKSTSKAPNGKSSKKTKPVSVMGKAFAPRRSRRNKKAQAYDEPEDSDMQDSSAEEDEMQSLRGKAEDTTSQTEASPNKSTSLQATSDDHRTNAKSQTSNLEKIDEARSQRKTMSHEVGTSAQHPIEFSDDSAPGADRSPEPSDSGGLQTTAPAASTVQSAKIVEPDVEVAEDSYPMSKAGVDAAASAAKGDFTDNLKAFLYPPGYSAPTNNQTSPAQPKTPFGDKPRFLQNVNASKSAKSTRSPQLSAAGAHHPSTSVDIGDEKRKLGSMTINPLHPTSDHSYDTSKQVTASAAPANHIENPAKPSALAPDHTAMPPPPKKELQGATLERAISKPGHRLIENGLKANELRPTTTHLTKRSNGYGTYARIMEKPARAPSATPATFHANMRDELEHSENARHSHESPMEPDDYANEANDRTLVNHEAEDLGPYPDFSRPVFRKNYGTTASTNDNSSIAGEEERAEKVADRAAWANGVRSSHQDLFGLVMQMTRDVLFRLCAEEDAIAAKQSDFDRGAELITNNLSKSWNDRLGHEMNRLVGDVEAERHHIKQIDLRARLSRDNETAQVKIPKEIELQELRKRLQKKDKVTHDLLKKLI